MLESMLYIQGKVALSPVKGDITFKTSGADTTITASALGTGFTTEYSIDGSPLTLAGDSFNIPAGDHEVILKLAVVAGTSLNLRPFKDILTEVTDWEDFQLPSIQFQNCTKLTKVPEQPPVAITNMTRMFYGCTSFNQDISQWDMSNVTNISFIFSGCASFNQDISQWDVSNVTNMVSIFQGCTSFNQDISQWDVSNVTNMGGVFDKCTSFNQDISQWDVGNVTSMSYMFRDCTSFNKDLSSMVFKSTVARTGYDSGATAWLTAYRPQFTG